MTTPSSGASSNNSPVPPGQTAPPRGGYQEPPQIIFGVYFDSAQASQFWNSLTKMMGSQIQAQQQQSLDALKKLNPDNQDN